ncbi:MAG: TIGR03016 family PEP-CTERM system-associated outer membrane protein [Candidatus Polarisedimenticolaceae bacterium]|nr:TIGR03016 family PEP-CTERM system-associated outer membrane protein [Candidatus Polarisedimenticolaceae bacterium]
MSHTDNVYLSSDKEGETIYRVTPAIQYSAGGERLVFNLDYQLVATKFAAHSSEDEVVNRLSSLANITVLNKLLFLDLSANIRQRAISQSEPIDSQQLSITDNYSEVLTTRVSPYVDTLLGQDVRLMLRYSHDNVTYGENSLDANDSEVMAVAASLASASSAGRISWSINYSDRTAKSDDVEDIRFEQIEGLLTLSPTEGWQIITSVGYENNDYVNADETEEREGESYGLGLQWQPAATTRIKVMGHDRYYGNSTTVEFVHSSGRTNYALNYSEEYTVDALSEAEQGTSLDSQNIGGISNQAFLQRRASLSIERRFIRSNVMLELQGDEREYQQDGTEERTVGVSMHWDRRLTQRTDLQIEMSWNQNEFVASDREGSSSTLYASLSHRFGRRIEGSLAYEHLNHNSTESGAEYARNLFTVNMRLSF